MRRALFILFIISQSVLAQSDFESFKTRVKELNGNTTAQKEVVDSFMNYARNKGIPFIEGNTAIFLYRGNVSSAGVAGDMNDWDYNRGMMTKLTGTDLFYYSRIFEPTARIDYKFVLNGSTWILDPENPQKVSGGYGPNSELAMPEYKQPWEIKYNNSIEHGKLIQKQIFSRIVNNNYNLNIYLPPQYSTLNKYPVVYFQDGAEYLSLASAANILDNLIDSSKIVPVIAVFVTPNNRNTEYAEGSRDRYRQFFIKELVPYIDSTYSTIPEPSGRLVLGDSFGGNISALISFNHPEVFGNCGLHSGAFWPNNYEAQKLIENSVLKPVKVFSVWGSYESLYQSWRPLKDSMIKKGYQIKWSEYPEGHSWGLWRATLDDMLIFFFPTGTSGVDEEIEDNVLAGYRLFQNYPNPFNAQTVISYSILNNSYVKLVIYDCLGREIATIVDEYQRGGIYYKTWDASAVAAGVYLYALSIEDYNGSGKIMSGKMVYLK